MKNINLKEKKFDKMALLIKYIEKLIDPVSWKINTTLLFLFGLIDIKQIKQIKD